MPSFFVCMVGTCGVAFFFFSEGNVNKIRACSEDKFHKLVEEIIIWEKMAAEISRVFVKEKFIAICDFPTETLMNMKLIIES